MAKEICTRDNISPNGNGKFRIVCKKLDPFSDWEEAAAKVPQPYSDPDKPDGAHPRRTSFHGIADKNRSQLPSLPSGCADYSYKQDKS
jgi:hypothetical protein